MSTEERTDDPGEHGYGSARQDSNIEEAENAIDHSDGDHDRTGDTPQETANRRAASSSETPSHVTRSTQDLTVGGSEKEPDATEEPAGDLSNAEQAVENQERDLKSGTESPG